ncbi:MAG: dihydropteroate synthase [Polyangiaceae bacterium]
MRSALGFGRPVEWGHFRRALDQQRRTAGAAVMAVLNVTPDSFYDGGRYPGALAIERLEEILASGAFAVDIGAESTRPGAEAVPARVQLERLEPVVRRAVHAERCWVSVDTADPNVADVALGWGAHVINDVSCLAKPELAQVVARHRAALVLMHARGAMVDMRGFSEYPEDAYDDIVRDVSREWLAAKSIAVEQGVDDADILFDPGIGFAKNANHSMTLVRRLAEFRSLGAPIVLGPSRKSFLNLIEARPPEERLGATLAVCLHAAECGADLLRVHDAQVLAQLLSAWTYLQGRTRNPVSNLAICQQREGA